MASLVEEKGWTIYCCLEEDDMYDCFADCVYIMLFSQ